MSRLRHQPGHPRESKTHKPLGALEAQTKQRVLLENGEAVTKREDLRMQGSAG